MCCNLYHTYLVKNFVSAGLSPSPLERSWGEVFLTGCFIDNAIEFLFVAISQRNFMLIYVDYFNTTAIEKIQKFYIGYITALILLYIGRFAWHCPFLEENYPLLYTQEAQKPKKMVTKQVCANIF
jgi:hypothetical protein